MITLNNGTVAGDGTGDILFDIFADTKANFTELDKRAVSAAADPTVNDDTGDGYQAGKTLWLNTSTRNLFLCVDHTAAAAVWQCLNPNQLNLATNDYYLVFTDMYFATGLCSADKLRLIAFKPAQRMTVDQLGMLLNATSANSFKAGIWASNGKVPTGNPLATIATTVAGSFATAANLSVYWFGDVHNGTMDKVSHQTIMNRLQGATGLSHLAQAIGNRGWHYEIAHTYANALPDLTGAGLTKRAALNGSEGPGVPFFRVSNIAP
jgi:hypothetical protein